LDEPFHRDGKQVEMNLVYQSAEQAAEKATRLEIASLPISDQETPARLPKVFKRALSKGNH